MSAYRVSKYILSGSSKWQTTSYTLRRYTTSGKETAREYLNKAVKPFEVFDRKAKRQQRDRAAARTIDSREVDYLRDEVAARVADRLLDIKRRYHTVVELGSGSGHLAKAVDDDMMDRLIMCEFSQHALNRDADAQYDVEVERRVMDEETPEFDDESLDAVVSSLSMHWVNDLPGMLIQIRKALVPDGVFIGAMLGGDSLFELRASLQLADSERSGGIAARVSPLTNTRDVGSLLNRAGLTLSTVDIDSIVVNYPSMLHLISDINAMGEGNAVVQRLPYIRRDTLLAASAIYKELYGNKDGTIPATFQVIYMIGWKPDPSQPKPLPRGSGKAPLGEIFDSTFKNL
ncbi:S-adenosyl-L-methionine-dependent methyltransferase [Coemansia reversa NRRL 1564]|uniref:S-adenosyl-L-methionine-dependent methyltransferase n=1 Tax=Coemansia reversa (strain ATCC 12441 / NRRL 1564) TaxID=763665 RepID=A0A2G5B9K4_COERN|nr:S-adenosyl-L-methionine-dependent methyltransferase [Coemansia reversa NRRL 1564]|eukprot:PIA15703.1 S-adenosyl-L-methionine-dependent methyltransferase [Coemansia reversa NRRL 1564]